MMRNGFILFILCFFLINEKSIIQAQGIEFFHGSFQEALDKAQAEGKLVFMDAFTTWCGPCRRMAANTFPDASVGNFYNENFINLKVDMEKGEGRDLSLRYAINSYPTLLYIDGQGKVVHRVSGGRAPEPFIELGKEALKKIDKSADFAKLYDAGDRDPKTVLAYIKSLNNAGKSSLKIANEYLATQTDLSTPENLEIILESTTEADSRIFDLLVQNKEKIILLKSKEVYDAKIYQSCHRTFAKSLEYRNESLLKEAQTKIKHHSTKEKEFVFQTNMEYYAKTGDVDKYLVAAKTYAKKSAKNDANKLTKLVEQSIGYFKTNKKVTTFAESLAKKAAQNGGLPTQYLMYANILKLNGKHSDAINACKKGMELAKEKNEPTHYFEQLMREIEKIKA
ncbi:MAG: thioredoxin family protein [Saprospiraceae bacterium]|nr:thioredoxin family protein [Saprospiraceae bacterium]